MLICNAAGRFVLVKWLVELGCFAPEAGYVSPVVGGGDVWMRDVQLGGGEALGC
jgi:hypothetical protein